MQINWLTTAHRLWATKPASDHSDQKQPAERPTQRPMQPRSRRTLLGHSRSSALLWIFLQSIGPIPNTGIGIGATLTNTHAIGGTIVWTATKRDTSTSLIQYFPIHLIHTLIVAIELWVWYTWKYVFQTYVLYSCICTKQLYLVNNNCLVGPMCHLEDRKQVKAAQVFKHYSSAKEWVRIV